MRFPRAGRLIRTMGALIVAVAAVIAVFSHGTPAVEAADPFQPMPCRAQIWNKGDARFTALAGAKAYFGEYAGGLYRVEIPDNWNGELVLYAHGYAGEGDLVQVGTPPSGWRAHLVEKGFAWAASSYRCNSYVPGIGLQDTLMLTSIFYDVNGEKAPRRTYLTGTSMGGHITLLGMHEYPTAFAGGLAMCPAGPGLFDYFAANGAAAEVVTGLAFSRAEPATATLAKMMAVFGTPPAYSAKGLQMASVMINSSGGPRPFVFEGLTAFFQRTISGSKLAGDTGLLSAAASNQDWTYGVDPSFGLTLDQLNSNVRRVSGDPKYRGADTPYPELRPFNGKIERPVVTMHTTGDMFVPIFLERELKAAVDKAGNSSLLVQRIYRDPAHCGFSSPEIIQAFDAMVAWAGGGSRPEGDDVSAPFTNAGLKFTSPLRPGDPGAIQPAPALRPPGPPATGTGLAESGSSDGPGLGVAVVVVVLAVVVLSMETRRRRSRR